MIHLVPISYIFYISAFSLTDKYRVSAVWFLHVSSVVFILLKWRCNFLKVSTEKLMGLIDSNSSAEKLMGLNLVQYFNAIVIGQVGWKLFLIWYFKVSYHFKIFIVRMEISNQTICMYWKPLPKSPSRNFVLYLDFDIADFSDCTSLQLEVLVPNPKHHQRNFLSFVIELCWN